MIKKYKLKENEYFAIRYYFGVEHPIIRHRDGDIKSAYVVDHSYSCRYLMPGDWIIFTDENAKTVLDVYRDAYFARLFEPITEQKQELSQPKHLASIPDNFPKGYWDDPPYKDMAENLNQFEENKNRIWLEDHKVLFLFIAVALGIMIGAILIYVF